MNQRRRWIKDERVEVATGFGTWRGTVVGEHLDGPRVLPDVDPDSEPRNVYYRDAWLLPPASQPQHIRELSA